jgi:hypothetical protein
VAAGDGIHASAMLDLLPQLVDKSLVIAEEHRGAVRFRLLETINMASWGDLPIRSGETKSEPDGTAESKGISAE